MPTLITLTGEWLSSDPDVGSNRLLPFGVPEGVSRIDVRYHVEGIAEGGHPSLDVGLFDPAGADFLVAEGFRGWSGTFRSEFFVSGDDATPGYTAGPIAPGTWQVLIGADKAMLTPSGLRYTIEIKLTKQSATRSPQS